ncbi:transporter substrate-binding protein [Oryzicola mucosus]|uniref:Transporter substrate-binding protein n=1 Tax=Oryzicola mucosus TaxID=2767425 RepID=A0A8J6PW22_9HYPH|nr:transporter substrate-binding protein [Oryzicola mucosus]MBD0417224.1 transporter substrate-binding protein [Oryzicola mucosus]
MIVGSLGLLLALQHGDSAYYSDGFAFSQGLEASCSTAERLGPFDFYLGASPNQHIVPLAHYMTTNFGRNVYLCGSDYIWPWESNRVMREIVNDVQGTVLAERYLAVGSVDIVGLVEEIRVLKPDFVFNTLIGESSYEFIKALHSAGLCRPSDGRPVPVASCTLSEAELKMIGVPAAANHIVSSVYFQSIETERNIAFVKRFRERFGPEKVTSADAEASYNSVHMFALAAHHAGSEDTRSVLEAITSVTFEAPQGEIWIDPDNNHCYLTPRIGISTSDADFRVIAAAQRPCKPDPFLASLKSSPFLMDARIGTDAGNTKKVAPRLQVVR